MHLVKHAKTMELTHLSFQTIIPVIEVKMVLLEPLRLLKKLALNSIRYTTLNEAMKQKCYKMFNEKWNALMEDDFNVNITVI